MIKPLRVMLSITAERLQTFFYQMNIRDMPYRFHDKRSEQVNPGATSSKQYEIIKTLTTIKTDKYGQLLHFVTFL